MKLRKYQKKTIEELFKKISNSYTKIGIRLPTGAGKSLVSAEIIKQFITENKKNLFVVKRQQLVNQTYKTFNSLGIKSSIIMGSDKRFSFDAHIQVCSIDTINKRNFNLSEIDVVHYDEAWDCTSPTYKKFMNLFSKKIIHIGYSGSYGFVGNKGHTFWQCIINPVSKMELTNEGFLVFPQVFTSQIEMKTTKKITGGDFNNKNLFQANDDMKVYGNIVTEYIKHGQNKKAFCFAINIEHSKKIVEEFKKNGINAVHVDSTFKNDIRTKILKDFEFGNIKILSNVGLYGVGTDVPCAEILICARPTKSTNLWEQMVGRVLRPYKDKKYALVLDHGGNTMRLGHPINDFEVQLENKTKNSVTQVEIKVYQCKSCYYIFSEKTDQCPMCGSKNEVKLRKIKEQKDAELKKFEQQKKEKECPYNLFKKRYFIDVTTLDQETRDMQYNRDLYLSRAKNRQWKPNSIFFKMHNEYSDKARLVLKYPAWFDKVLNEQLHKTPESNSENPSDTSEGIS